ncbi:MAG: ring-cleaving dioxygenase [Caldilineaceae bacterium]
MNQTIAGLHHITAFASDPQRNIDFYSQVLGQRLVKRTVNFDDPGTYHFYYGDQIGSPGAILTFFPWPGAPRGRLGNGEVGAAAYRIAPAAVGYWQQRLQQHGVTTFETQSRFGETVLVLQDVDGMVVELVATESAGPPQYWADGPIPPEHALAGFHGITNWVSDAAQSAALLTDVMGYRLVGEEGARLRFQANGALGHFVDLMVRPNQPRGRMGAGSIHHVAFRTPDDAAQIAWQSELAARGYGVSEVRDRQYFHSIYFHEPSGILYEIATDAPGFATDESVGTLGQQLKLPPWLERSRAQIEQVLPPIHL